ncbi:uncharacterized protein [Diadema antillarum]|uniref:uncharacterized protein n=1 Tax=Diadema antillarum TaxID=105358 RepID=UPI003A8C3A1A
MAMNAVPGAMISQKIPSLMEEGEDDNEDGADMEEEDVFFTEADYEMYSWRRTLDITAIVRCKRHANKPLAMTRQREKISMKSQSAPHVSVEPWQPIKATVSKIPSIVPTVSLSSPFPDLDYPDFSRLTVGQHRKFLELQTKFGTKGIRVTTSQDSFEHQQWRQLGAQIYQDQQDFNTFAEFASRRFPENYLVVSAAAVQYMRECLRVNLVRVESLPRHYTVLQTATLNPGVPLPSDATLQRIGAPVITGKIPKMTVPELSESKMFLRKTLSSGQEMVNASKSTQEATEEDNAQRLAEFHGVDIVLSGSSLLSLVDNHVPHYEQQWEIPVEVKANAESTAKQKVVFVRKPLMKHAYYPHEANAIYHKFALKRILVSETRDRYGRTSDERDEQEDDSATMHGDDEFGDSSLWDLETFGTDIQTTKMEVRSKEEAEELVVDQPADRELCSDPLVSVSEDYVKSEMKAVSPSLDNMPDPSDVTDMAVCDAGSDAGIPAKVQSGVQDEILRTTSEKTDAAGDERSSLPLEALDAKDSNGCSQKGIGPNPGMDSGGAGEVLDIGKTLEAIAHNSDSKVMDDVAVDDVAMDTNQGELEEGKDDQVLAAPTQGRKIMVRTHTLSECSSDDENRLCIVTDDDRHVSDADVVGKREIKETAEKCTSEDEQKASTTTKPVKQTVLEHNSDSQTSIEGTDLKESDLGTVGDDVTDEKTGMDDGREKEEKKEEHPAGRMATRRSARIQNQSSSEEKSHVDPPEPATKKRLRKKMLPKEDVEMKDDEGSLGPRKRGRRRKVRVNDEDEMKDEKTESKESKKDVSSDGRTDEGDVNQKAGNAESAGRGEEGTKETNSSVASAKTEMTVAQSDDSDTSKNLDLGADEGATVPPTGNVQKERSQRLQAKRARLLTKTVPTKTSPPEKQAKKRPIATRGSGPMESTIDEIMRLQEKMLTSKQSATPAQSHAEDGPAQGQSSRGQGGSGPQIPLTGSQVAGIELREPSEGNCAYSLWKFGRLRMLIKNRVHGLVTEQVTSVVSKMERQAELGFEMQTASDLTRIWLNMYLHPGSKVIRGRIDAKTSQVLSWESLDSAAVINSQQTINPGMCLKMLYHVLLKLAALSPGRYLLRHRPGDAHVCIYQCMEQAAKNVRSSYDLLAAHQASKLLEAPPPTLSWVPLDCNAPYPANRWRGRVPLTFPPRPPALKKQPTQQGGKHKKKKKKKKATPANG